MNPWTTIRIAYPADDLDLANRAGAILDPDIGGDRTFDSGRTLLIGGAEHIYADVPMQYPKPDITEARNPQQWYAVLSALAAQKGLEPLTLEECAHLCSAALVGDECLADDPVIPEEITDPEFDALSEPGQ